MSMFKVVTAVRALNACRMLTLPARQLSVSMLKMMPGDELGRGAGKGGGAGGSIREAGGAFGKNEAAQEEEYFYRLQREQLSKLRDIEKEEIESLEDTIAHEEDLLRRKKRRLEKLKKKQEDESSSSSDSDADDKKKN